MVKRAVIQFPVLPFLTLRFTFALHIPVVDTFTLRSGYLLLRAIRIGAMGECAAVLDQGNVCFVQGQNSHFRRRKEHHEAVG